MNFFNNLSRENNSSTPDTDKGKGLTNLLFPPEQSLSRRNSLNDQGDNDDSSKLFNSNLLSVNLTGIGFAGSRSRRGSTCSEIIDSLNKEGAKKDTKVTTTPLNSPVTASVTSSSSSFTSSLVSGLKFTTRSTSSSSLLNKKDSFIDSPPSVIVTDDQSLKSLPSWKITTID